MGSSSRPRDCAFSEMAMALMEKSRRRRSSMIPGEAVFGLGAGTLVDIVARGGNGAVHVAGENHLVVAQLLAFPRHARAALFEFAHHAHGIALDGEIQIADRLAGDQVANRAAGQIDIHFLRARQFLHALERGSLFRRKPAFQQEHVIGHEVCAPPRLSRAMLQARG